MLLYKVSICAVVDRHRQTRAQRSNMQINRKTKSRFVNVFSDCNQFISASHITCSQGQSSHPVRMLKWFFIVSHFSSFKLSITLQQLHAVHLEEHSTHNLSWEIIIKQSKQKLWNNRIGGTPPFHCCSTSCYSLVPEMLTLTQYFVTLTSKQDFIYLFIYLVMWHGSEGRLDSLYTHHCSVKNIFMQTF